MCAAEIYFNCANGASFSAKFQSNKALFRVGCILVGGLAATILYVPVIFFVFSVSLCWFGVEKWGLYASGVAGLVFVPRGSEVVDGAIIWCVDWLGCDVVSSSVGGFG